MEKNLKVFLIIKKLVDKTVILNVTQNSTLMIFYIVCYII